MKQQFSYIFSLVLLALLTLVSCDRSTLFIDGIDGADKTAFKVFSTNLVDLSKTVPENLLVPEGDEGKTTSVGASALVADLFEYGRKGKVLELAGSYTSMDIKTLSPVELSGKVLLPKGRKPKRYIVVSHYTICSNEEAPSNVFPLEGILTDLGYAMIFPDYQGYGIDCARIHPYLLLYQNAYDVAMMYLSVKQYLKGTEYEPEEDDIYLMGYSQGGAVAMSTLWLMEKHMGRGDEVAQVFAGGGPYDVRATFNNFIETNTVHIAPAVPMVIQSMIACYGANSDMADVLQPWVCDKLDEWINSKNFTVNQLRDVMGTTTTSDILTSACMDRTGDTVSELYKAMTENSVLAQDWTPATPIYMLHSIDDDVVPFVNATKAKDKWKDANIQYNFGHYGSHMKTCLRFIFTVQTSLKEGK